MTNEKKEARGRTIKIEVTADDIENGSARRARCCPIALACRRAGLEDPAVFPGMRDGQGSIFHGPADPIVGRKHIPLPEVAAEFIIAIDEGAEVEPFSFEVTP